jgi:hypothetical protein
MPSSYTFFAYIAKTGFLQTEAIAYRHRFKPKPTLLRAEFLRRIMFDPAE